MKLRYLITFVIFIFSGLIYLFINTQEDLIVDHAEVDLEGVACEVYFFKSWGTYSHPVTPIDPIDYEVAIMREGFCLAWMCNANDKKLFAKFQARTNNIRETDLVKPSKNQKVEYYEYLSKGDGLKIGKQINIDEAISHEKFLISSPDSSNTMVLIEQDILYTYRYIYNADGSLKKVIVTNMLGEESTLNY